MIDGWLLAAAPAAGASSFPAVLVSLVGIFVATKLLGDLAQRLGQPSVLGELLAGVLLGGSVLGLVDASNPVLHAMAEIGVLVLLFTIGLETDLRSLIRVGKTATAVAITGVVLPFALGYWAARALGVATLPALVCGAALCATSIGISARVLSDLGALDTPEGQVVLAAAVMDDIVGLIILAVVGGIAAGGGISVPEITRTSLVAVGFVVFAVLLGRRIAPPAFKLIERIRTSGTLGLMGLAFAFTLAWLAHRAGSAMIVGAFAAGLILYNTPQRDEIERATTRLGHFFVPIFFANVGAAVDLRALSDPRALAVGGALIVAGVVGKVLAGYAPWWFRWRKLLVGVAMVPRGEVGLIFAQMGLATGVIDPGLFGALMLMVLATTLMTPPVLNRLVKRMPGPRADYPGEGGIDDLVAGVRPHR